MNKNNKSVTLTEFGDYECPHCGRAYPIVKQLQKEFGDKLQLDFKNFPLVELHPHALMAAEAAEFARAQNKFDEMHDALFENQTHLSPKLIQGIAEKIGLNIEKFTEALAKHTYVPEIQRDVNEGIDKDVQGTPTFFINGRLFTKPWTHENLESALKQKLATLNAK